MGGRQADGPHQRNPGSGRKPSGDRIHRAGSHPDGEDFGHIEDLLQEDFSDVGKTESGTFTATFTLPEEQHQSVNRYIEDYGKMGLSKAVMDRVKGLA